MDKGHGLGLAIVKISLSLMEVKYGQKASWDKKHFFRAATILISFLLIGCVTTEVKQQDPEKCNSMLN